MKVEDGFECVFRVRKLFIKINKEESNAMIIAKVTDDLLMERSIENIALFKQI